MAGSHADYENAVLGITAMVQDRLGAGESPEVVARAAIAMRNALKVQFREGLPQAVISEMERRNLGKYGDPIGPTPQWLFEKYGNWEEVANAAARPAALRHTMLRFMPKRNGG